jgi:hypothetical protein
MHEVSRLVRGSAKVKDTHHANAQSVVVQKLWMKGEYPVDGSTTKKNCVSPAGQFVDPAGCGCAFVARFA